MDSTSSPFKVPTTADLLRGYMYYDEEFDKTDVLTPSTANTSHQSHFGNDDSYNDEKKDSSSPFVSLDTDIPNSLIQKGQERVNVYFSRTLTAYCRVQLLCHSEDTVDSIESGETLPFSPLWAASLPEN